MLRKLIGMLAALAVIVGSSRACKPPSIQRRPCLGDVAILAVVLAAGSYAAFILLLKLQIPVFPAFFGA